MRKLLLWVLLPFGLTGCFEKARDPLTQYDLFEAVVANHQFVLTNGLMVANYPSHTAAVETQGDIIRRLDLILKLKDRHVAAIKLDGGIALNGKPLLEMIETPQQGAPLCLNEAGKSAELGSWQGKFRLLLVAMKEGDPKGQNMIIRAAKVAFTEADQAGDMKVLLSGAQTQALSLKEGRFFLGEVSPSDFTQNWDGFIKKDKPNGFLSFRDGGGEVTVLALEFLKAERAQDDVSLWAHLLVPRGTAPKETLRALQAAALTAKDVVVFVDYRHGNLPD